MENTLNMIDYVYAEWSYVLKFRKIKSIHLYNQNLGNTSFT